MPKKAKLKPKEKTTAYRAAEVAAVTAVVLSGIVLIFHTIDYFKMRGFERNLQAANQELDSLVEPLEQAVPGADISRTEECDRTNEKYSAGQIICYQKLNITNNSINDEQILDELNEAYIKLQLKDEKISLPPSSFETNDYLSTTDRLHVFEDFSCRVDLSAANNTVYRVTDRGKYNIEIRCFESGLVEPIYPMRDKDY